MDWSLDQVENLYIYSRHSQMVLQSLLFLWQASMLNWMLYTRNYFKVSHRKQVSSPSNMKLVTSMMNFECQPCEIFESLLYHQENEVIDTTIFAATIGLGYRINKFVS